MPTFSTPEPISATIELVVGDVHITASDRQDTIVEVRPSNTSHERDVRAAEQTRVEYATGALLIKAARQRNLGLFGKVGSVDVAIELPAGSRLHAQAQVATFRAVGELGQCRIKTSAGDIRLDHSGGVDLHTSGGAIGVDLVVGHAEISTGTGRVEIREIDGTAVIKNSNGDCWVGEITGDLRVNAADGDIGVDRAHADVTASTANGDVRIGELHRGSAALKTACGEIEIGIRSGTAALLDVHTSFGRVRNQLESAPTPAPTEETVEVRARTSFGDVVIHRS